MTREERRKPEVLSQPQASHRRRCRRAGARVNRMLNQFEQMRTMMKKLKGAVLMR